MIIHGKYCCNKEPQKAGMKHFENLKKFLKEIQYLFIHLFISYIFMYLFSLSLLNSYWYSQNWVLGMENKVKSSRLQMFFRIGVFKIFADFTGKRLWWIQFLVNYTLLKRDSNTSFFLWNLQKHLFLQNIHGGCFYRAPESISLLADMCKTSVTYENFYINRRHGIQKRLNMEIYVVYNVPWFQTSKVELFVRMFNVWKSWTIFAKSVIFDVWLGFEDVFDKNIFVNIIAFFHSHPEWWVSEKKISAIFFLYSAYSSKCWCWNNIGIVYSRLVSLWSFSDREVSRNSKHSSEAATGNVLLKKMYF